MNPHPYETCPKNRDVYLIFRGRSAGATFAQDRQPLLWAEITEDKCPYQSITDAYHRICSSWPRLLKSTPARQRAMRARWRENGESLQPFEEVFTKAANSTFLSSNTRRWCTFEWLVNPNNWAKVLEGRYDNKPPAPTPDQYSRFRNPAYLKSILDQIAFNDPAAGEAMQSLPKKATWDDLPPWLKSEVEFYKSCDA